MSRLRLKPSHTTFRGHGCRRRPQPEVADGEFLTLLGPSGCGKTTTLRMIAGFLGPDAGDIWFDDRRMTDVPPHRRNTAMVFQSYALFPHMSVAENVGFGLLMRKLPKAESAARVAEALELVSLTGLEDRRPGQLSGGQQQRVGSGARHRHAPGHPAVRRAALQSRCQAPGKVRVEIRELQRRLRITSIYVTHDQAEALVVSDRIVVMNRGRIEQIGDPDTIYRAPDNAFVADFIGLTNIVEGTLLDDRTVDTPIGRLRIDGGQPLKSTRVKLIWRPEDMKATANGLANRLSGTVRQVIFRGNVTEFTFDVNGHSLRGQLDNDLAASGRRGHHSSASTPTASGSSAEMRPRLAIVLLCAARRRLHLPVPGSGTDHYRPAERRRLGLRARARVHLGVLGGALRSAVPRLVPVLGQGRRRQRLRHAPAGLSAGAVPAATARRARASSDRS